MLRLFRPPLRLLPVQSTSHLRSMSSSNQPGPPSSESEHKYTNRLVHEKSPYLLQHAHNPVDWYPWGEEAFLKARRENKPIFLSVGYSTCHWCHVMEKESFEKEEVARVMNEYFVNVKVDRETMPDVDRVYMLFVQQTSGSGGWPMSVWLTPELRPFFGGTYFPPFDQHGRTGFVSVCKAIAERWKTDSSNVLERSEKLLEILRDMSTPESNADSSKLPKALCARRAYKYYEKGFDGVYGGFGGEPKFPTPPVFTFLTTFNALGAPPLLDLTKLTPAGVQALAEKLGLDVDSSAGSLEKALEERKQQCQNALTIVTSTLEHISKGGIHDHIGSGFHRYSVDRRWHVPHFEKMLYDQAQLLSAYVDAYRLNKKQEFANVAQDIMHYINRDLAHQDGGFYSAEDADSYPYLSAKEKLEGAFAVWTWKEIIDMFGEQRGEIIASYFGIKKDGNVDPAHDIQGELKGKNVLFVARTFQQLASTFLVSEQEVESLIEVAKRKMWETRQLRPKPHLDDKIITAWNGLMVSGLSKAYQAMQKQDIYDTATRTATFICQNLYDAEKGELLRSYRGDSAGQQSGSADDYAFLIQGLLDLYHCQLDEKWLRWARELQQKQDDLFWDAVSGGYFSGTTNSRASLGNTNTRECYVAKESKDILLRLKDDYDGAEPSSTSVSTWNLLRLSTLLPEDETLADRLRKIMAAFYERLMQFPHAVPSMTAAVLSHSIGMKHVILEGDANAPELKGFLRALHGEYLPNCVVSIAHRSRSDGFLWTQSEIYRTMAENASNSGAPRAHVCVGNTCGMPVTTIDQLLEDVRQMK